MYSSEYTVNIGYEEREGLLIYYRQIKSGTKDDLSKKQQIEIFTGAIGGIAENLRDSFIRFNRSDEMNQIRKMSLSIGVVTKAILWKGLIGLSH